MCTRIGKRSFFRQNATYVNSLLMSHGNNKFLMCLYRSDKNVVVKPCPLNVAVVLFVTMIATGQWCHMTVLRCILVTWDSKEYFSSKLKGILLDGKHLQKNISNSI